MSDKHTLEEIMWKSTATLLGDLRNRKGETLEQVSKALGISKATLSGYENYDKHHAKKMSMDIFHSLAKYYGVSTNYLVGMSDDDVEIFNKYGFSKDFVETLIFYGWVERYDKQTPKLPDTLNKIVSAKHSWSALIDNIGHYFNEEGDSRKIHLFDIITLLEACHSEIYPKTPNKNAANSD